MHPHKNPRALLTPGMRKLLERMEHARQVPLHCMAPQQAREAYAVRAEVLEIPRLVLDRVEDFEVPARDGYLIPVRLYAAVQGTLPVLVYLHGGGFTIGSIATHDILCRSLAQLAGCAVLAVDYRLAPEFRFPTAHCDAWDVVQWVAKQGGQRQLDSQRIALGGDSAGGTLAAACAIEARDAGIPIALQLLFYPGTVGHQNTDSHRTFAHGFVLEAASIDYFFGQYLRSEADRDDWRFAPLDGLRGDGHPVDLTGVAPAWLGLAECDPLVDEGVDYADRLRLAGVPVELEIYRGVVHEFIKMGRALPEALQAHAEAAAALRRVF